MPKVQHDRSNERTEKKKKKAEKRMSAEGADTGVRQGHHGIVFNKTFGQHILRNPLVINAIVEKAGLSSTDTVLEIGPGTGNLTEKLLQKAKKVIAMEIDPRMVSELHKRFMSGPLGSKLQIIQGNCIKQELPFFNVCVANVPYAISSALVFQLLKHTPSFRCAVLMFQREFAMRLVAKPNSSMYCRLSSNTQLLSKVDHLMKISKNSFKPPPKVESSVVRIEPKRPAPEIAFEEWDGLIKICFNRPNKTLGGNFHVKATLAHLLTLHRSYCEMLGKPAQSDTDFKKTVEEVLERTAFIQRRARTMEEPELLLLLESFHEKDVYFA
ncbi:putative dimethyladenosine transferase [Diplonema papillatum]|nr:putative dimethyladenosine transferase [Diplonema papillatum]|eukprot:gene3780-5891_t